MSTRGDNPSCGLPWQWQVAALCLAAALVISREPEAIFRAQFYGEDGKVWFADAYNHGWFPSLFRSYTGYFQTLPRLAAALALVPPLLYSPVVMSLVGLAVQVLPVRVLLSTRMSRWGSLRFRAMLAFVYLALPNCRELNVTVTEAQWHLALVACLVVLSETPKCRVERIFDFCVLFLCGLTGPFCIPLLLVTLLSGLLRRDTHRWATTFVLASAAAIQLCGLVLISSSRQYPLPLGASFEWLVRIVAGQVYLASILGANPLASLGSAPLLFVAAIAGSAIVCFAVCRAVDEFRLFLLFAAILFAASLRSPLPGPPGSAKTAWQALAAEPGVHYWFFPTLAFSWSIISLLLGQKRNQLSQALGTLLICAMCIGVIRDWRHAAYPDLHFAIYAAKLTDSQRGTSLLIPEAPTGWTLTLVKK